jgi:hypothetical protein
MIKLGFSDERCNQTFAKCTGMAAKYFMLVKRTKNLLISILFR